MKADIWILPPRPPPPLMAVSRYLDAPLSVLRAVFCILIFYHVFLLSVCLAEETPEPPAQEVAIPKPDVPPTDTTPPVEVPMPVVEHVSPPSVDETDRTSITPPLKSMKSPVLESDTPTMTKQKSILKPTTCSVPEVGGSTCRRVCVCVCVSGMGQSVHGITAMK